MKKKKDRRRKKKEEGGGGEEKGLFNKLSPESPKEDSHMSLNSSY